MAQKVKGSRCLTSKYGNILCFIPGSSPGEGLWIWLQLPEKTYRPSSSELIDSKPMNQAAWTILMPRLKNTLRKLTDEELVNVKKAVEERTKFFELPKEARGRYKPISEWDEYKNEKVT